MTEQVGMTINASHGRHQVIIQFDRRVGYIGMDPHKAIEFGRAVIEKAKSLKGHNNKSPIIIP